MCHFVDIGINQREYNRAGDTQINAVTVEQIDTASKSDAQSMTSASLIRRENMMK